MSFPTNTSPYGSNPQQFQLSPQGGMQQAGGNKAGIGSHLLSLVSPFAGAIASRGQEGGLWQSLFGKPERNYQQSLLGQNQQPLLNQLLGASQGRGAGGAFGESADYYRSLLGNNPEDFQAFAAPELRRFQQDIIPDLAEQFSGYGGIGSSGFRNAATQAGTDLSERLASMRANLRGQGAAGLQNIGQLGLGPYNENIHRPETSGLVGGLFEGAGKSLGNFAASKIPGLK